MRLLIPDGKVNNYLTEELNWCAHTVKAKKARKAIICADEILNPILEECRAVWKNEFLSRLIFYYPT